MGLAEREEQESLSQISLQPPERAPGVIDQTAFGEPSPERKMSRMVPGRAGQLLSGAAARFTPSPRAGRAGGFLALAGSILWITGQRQALGDYTSVTVLLPLKLPEGTGRAGRKLSVPPQQAWTSSLEALTRQKPVDPGSINAFGSFKPFLGHHDFLKLRGGATLKHSYLLDKEQPWAAQGISQVNTQA